MMTGAMIDLLHLAAYSEQRNVPTHQSISRRLQLVRCCFWSLMFITLFVTLLVRLQKTVTSIVCNRQAQVSYILTSGCYILGKTGPKYTNYNALSGPMQWQREDSGARFVDLCTVCFLLDSSVNRQVWSVRCGLLLFVKRKIRIDSPIAYIIPHRTVPYRIVCSVWFVVGRRCSASVPRLAVASRRASTTETWSKDDRRREIGAS